MRARQPLPRLWMMTDERQGADLLDQVARLPRGAGIVFRHYSLGRAKRRALFDSVRAIAWRRGLVLLLGGPPALAAAWGADGSHGAYAGKASAPHLLRSVPVHNPSELRAATLLGADLIFVSPVFATRSHPETRPLGPVRMGLLVRSARRPVIALGGMSAAGARRVASLGPYGWAGIDAFA